MTSMTKNLSLSLALALAAVATGCAADSPDQDDDGGGGGGGGDDAPQPLDASGRFQLRSNFDLATNAPGKAGEVTRAIIDATDSPDDPTGWIRDQIIAKLPSGTYKNVLTSSKPFIAGYLNDRLLDLAPDFVSTMVQVGNDFGQISKNFGLNETLEITKAGADYTSMHTVLGAHFKIDNIESDHMFADFNTENVVAPNVGVTLDQAGKLGIADHKVAVSYGKILRIGLDGAIIPMIDPTAANLGQLLQHKVDCVKVGLAVRDAIASVIGYGGSASTYQTACNQGLLLGASVIYAKITAIDSTALEFGITGTAKGIDKNNDRQVDSILTGAWSGNLSYGATPAPLAGATFYGERM